MDAVSLLNGDEKINGPLIQTIRALLNGQCLLKSRQMCFFSVSHFLESCIIDDIYDINS